MKISSIAGCASVAIGVTLAQGADLDVSGNLSVAGNVDVQGDTISVGAQSGSATTPGVSLLYLDAPAPSVYFSATRDSVEWLWQRSTGKAQMKLGADNKLQLYDQAATPNVKVTLDPLGVSSFQGPVQFNGASVFAGAATYLGSVEVAGGMVVEGALNVSGSIVSASLINIVNSAGNVEVGTNNGIGLIGYNFNQELGGAAIGAFSIQIAGDQRALIEYILSQGLWGCDVVATTYAGNSFSIPMFYESNPVFYIESMSYAGGVTTVVLGGVPQWSNFLMDETDYVNYAGLRFFWREERRAHDGVVFGSNNMVGTDYSIAFGRNNQVGAETGSLMEYVGSGAFGFENAVYGENAFAFGRGLINSHPNSVQIGASDAGKVHIAADGSLGIGTEDPGAKLHVIGDARVQGGATVSGVVTAGKIRVPESGDLSMGDFKVHGGLGVPAPAP